MTRIPLRWHKCEKPDQDYVLACLGFILDEAIKTARRYSARSKDPEEFHSKTRSPGDVRHAKILRLHAKTQRDMAAAVRSAIAKLKEDRHG